MTKLLIVVVAAATLSLASACTPPDPGGGTSGPVCYDNTDPITTNYFDLSYIGTPDVAGNITVFTSDDGSCTSPRYRGTVVTATTAAQATPACGALGQGTANPMETTDLAGMGYAGLVGLWACSQNLPLCYDNADPIYLDVTYGGRPNVVGNATVWNSYDGSCTSGRYRVTLVTATSTAEATTACAGLGQGIGDPNGDMGSQGYAGLDGVWLCDHTLPL